MTKTTYILTGHIRERQPNFSKSFSRLALIVPAIGILSLAGCAATKDAPSQPKEQPAIAAKPAAPKPESSPAPVPSQGLQELTVREEQGQTTLLVKFIQPVTQYRHFTLPQPARIVLDILRYK